MEITLDTRLYRIAAALMLALLLLGGAPGSARAKMLVPDTVADQLDGDAGDMRQLSAMLADIAQRPVVDEGPARIEVADYYFNEIIRDENWEEWFLFQFSPRVIIPMASAKFYMLSSMALSKLKKPTMTVIIAASRRTIVQGTAHPVAKVDKTYQLLDRIGLLARGESERIERGWDLGALFDTDSGADPVLGLERDWDWWFVVSRTFLVAMIVIMGLVFVELLRFLVGAGVRVLARTTGRRGSSLRDRKKMRTHGSRVG